MTQDALRTLLEESGWVVPFGPLNQRPGAVVWVRRAQAPGFFGLRLRLAA